MELSYKAELVLRLEDSQDLLLVSLAMEHSQEDIISLALVAVSRVTE